MAFDNTVLQDNLDLPAGEVIKASPYNVSAFEVFEDGLRAGRFAKYDNGSLDNLDNSATPTIAGIVRRKISGEIETGTPTYSATGQEIDQVAEVINFGFATVEITDTANPSKYDAVNVLNSADADAGKATEEAVAGDIIAINSDVVFWEQKAANVWLVRIGKFL